MTPLALFFPYILSLCCTVVQGSAETSEQGVVDIVGQNSSRGYRQCRVAGDPHVWSFCGVRFDPMHGTGHWWIMKTGDKSIMVQGTYGGCGMKNGRGWQSSRLQGIPRTCLTSIGISGSFIKDKVVGIKSPCDWDWGKSKCRNSPRSRQPPVIMLDGQQRTNGFTNLVPGVHLTVRENVVYFRARGVYIQVNFGGRHWSRSANTFMNLYLKTMQPRGEQCGHCGPWDCSHNVRNLFNPHGGLKPNQPEHCKADVTCDELYVKDSYSCRANDPDAEDLTMADCPEDHQAMSRFTCKQAFAERDMVPSADEMEECIMDACFGGDYFAQEDAKEAARERECAENKFELEQNLQDAQWEVEDNEMFVEWDCPNGEPVADVIRYDRYPRDLAGVRCGVRECPRAVARYSSMAESWKRRVRRLAMDLIKRKDRCDESIRYLAEAREKLRAAQEALDFCNPN